MKEEENNKYISKMEGPEDRLNSMFTLIRQFVNFLWPKKIIIIAGIAMIAGILGATKNYYSDPLYTATITFALDEESGGLDVGGLAAQFGLSLGGGGGNAFKGENLLEIFKSRTVVQRTLLDEKPVKGKATVLINHLIDLDYPKFKDIEFGKGKRDLFRDSIISVLHDDIVKNYLKVSKVDKNLIFVTVSFRSKDQFFSKIFVEALINNVIEFYTESKTKKSKQNVNMMTRELDSLKGLMTGAMYRSATLGDLNVNPIKQILRAPIQSSNADAQVFLLAYGEILKNLELAKVTLLKETPLIQIIDLPVLPLKKEKKGRLYGLIVWGGILFLLLMIFYYIKFLLHLRNTRKQVE